jgi:hypothetical protein
MEVDVYEYVQTCPSCQRNKPRTTRPGGLLQPLPVPTRRWDSVSMDLITDLPTGDQGHTAIFVVVDRLTKMAHFVPTTKECTAEEIARIFIRDVYRLHGMPSTIVADRDPRWTGHFWGELSRWLS